MLQTSCLTLREPHDLAHGSRALPADIEREVVSALQQTVIKSHQFRPEREPNTSFTAIPFTFYFDYAIGGLS